MYFALIGLIISFFAILSSFLHPYQQSVLSLEKDLFQYPDDSDAETIILEALFEIDATHVVANVSRFWTSTGFCGPDPHQDVCDWLLMPSMTRNIALIGAIPFSGIRQIRAHWLLDSIKITKFAAGFPVYNFTCLDSFVDVLWQHGLMPGFEVMGNPSNFFTDLENVTQILHWSDLVFQIASRYIGEYGVGFVSQWNFESWNEPHLKHFDGLNLTISGFLNYYDATAAGLRKASPLLRLGGPGGECSLVYDLKSYCWALLDHAQNGINYFTSKKDVKLDFISIHKKGKPPLNTDVILNREVDFVAQMRQHLPILANKVPLFNDEADPEVSWNINRAWQADVTYAAMAAKIIIEHQNRRIFGLLAGIDYMLLSNDNAFLSYQPYPFTQRTQVARFQVNTTNPPHVQFVRKPIYSVMGLLALLGDKQVDVVSDSRKMKIGNLNILATVHQPLENEFHNGLDSWQMSVIVCHSNDSQPLSDLAQVSLSLKNLPKDKSLMYAVYCLDNERSNPFQVWTDAGSPSTPDWKTFNAMRLYEEPFRVIEPMPWLLATDEVKLLNLSRTSVALLHLCTLAERLPDQVTSVVAYNVTFNQVQLVWSDSCIGTKCIKTYEVEFSPEAGDGSMFKRINIQDTFFTSFFYTPSSSGQGKESTRGFYRVRVVDFWNRAGEYSLVLRYPSDTN